MDLHVIDPVKAIQAQLEKRNARKEERIGVRGLIKESGGRFSPEKTVSCTYNAGMSPVLHVLNAAMIQVRAFLFTVISLTA